MYSRRFNDHGVTPPPDYGGVAYRQKEEEQVKQSERTAASSETAGGFSEEQVRSTAAPRERLNREERHIRRPIYSPPRTGGARTTASRGTTSRPAAPFSRQSEREQEKGLLSGLFSLTGRKFSMEDIVLAGLILLLMSDRENEGSDGEILLILGLLLLTK